MKIASVFAALALATSLFAAPTASSILSKAESTAQKEHKNVMVIFHASWCGWCHRLDETFLADKEMAKIMKDNFVVIHLDVLENGPKKELENAGGMDLMKEWNGANSGVPFLVVLNGNGEKLIDSNLTGKDGSNIGYPAKPEEIAHFIKMLKTSPNISDGQIAKVQEWLTAHAPKN